MRIVSTLSQVAELPVISPAALVLEFVDEPHQVLTALLQVVPERAQILCLDHDQLGKVAGKDEKVLNRSE